jgi:hypothetical protein
LRENPWINIREYKAINCLGNEPNNII